MSSFSQIEHICTFSIPGAVMNTSAEVNSVYLAAFKIPQSEGKDNDMSYMLMCAMLNECAFQTGFYSHGERQRAEQEQWEGTAYLQDKSSQSQWSHCIEGMSGSNRK